jgi:hypothetical protein
MTSEATSRSRAAERLEELRGELANGEQLERQLVVQRGHVRERQLRISGAIEVLEELLADEESEGAVLRRASG